MNPSLESQITSLITSDGSVIVPPRIARWLERQANVTADRRIKLRDIDPDAYAVLVALHIVALGSDSGTNSAAAQHVRTDSTMWMSTGEAARELGVTDRCVRKWCRTGRLAAVMSGGRWLINRNTLATRNIG